MRYRLKNMVALLVFVGVTESLWALNYGEVGIEGMLMDSDSQETWGVGSELKFYPQGIDANGATVRRPYALIPFWDRLGLIGLHHYYVEGDGKGGINGNLKATQYGLSGQYSMKSTNMVLRASYSHFNENVRVVGDRLNLVPMGNGNDTTEGRWTTEYDIWVYLLGVESFENPTDPTTRPTPVTDPAFTMLEIETEIFSVGYGYYLTPLSLLSVDYAYWSKPDYEASYGDGNAPFLYRRRYQGYDLYEIRINSFSVIELNEKWVSIDAGITYEHSLDRSVGAHYTLDIAVDYYIQQETSIGLDGRLQWDEDRNVEESGVGVEVTHYFRNNLSITGGVGYLAEENEASLISMRVGVQIRL